MRGLRQSAGKRTADLSPLENDIVRLRAQIRALEEGNGAQIKALEAEKADLQAEKSDQAAKHDEDYRGIWGLYNEGLDENMQQFQHIVELEFENEELKDQMAMMATEGPVAGFGGDLSAEEQAYQQAKQQHSS